MARTQRFILRETVPGLPGEWVCYGCKQPMAMLDPGPEHPAGAMEMEHTDGCEEVRGLAAGG